MEPLFLAYSLSGAAGLRSAFTVLVVALCVHFGYLHPNPSFAWVGSWWVVGVASTAAVAEFLADKVPVLDHALHALHFILAPLAGAIVATSGYRGDLTTDLLLAVLGGSHALFIHSARSGLRAASTATTAGLANPLISLAEDGVSAIFIGVAILVPWLTALALIVLTYWLIRKIRRRRSS
ncbi:MAG TPA: DUF4126 domain-containing protein [Steroidobacteraceae bacterium]|nr:DUF4126 domain-containing protein [Steroidobacteraceae bacterium]